MEPEVKMSVLRGWSPVTLIDHRRLLKTVFGNLWILLAVSRGWSPVTASEILKIQIL